MNGHCQEGSRAPGNLESGLLRHIALREPDRLALRGDPRPHLSKLLNGPDELLHLI